MRPLLAPWLLAAGAQSKDHDLQQGRLMRSLFVRAVMATGLIDRAYGVFDRLRDRIVVAYGSDEFFNLYNDRVYGRKEAYRMATVGLFPFEARAISDYFPAPPATVLIGAAGAGREARVLARQGYRIVAFEPIRHLAVSLAEACDGPERDRKLRRTLRRSALCELPFESSRRHQPSLPGPFFRCHRKLGEHLAPSIGSALRRDPSPIRRVDARTNSRQLLSFFWGA
jgi:hypothetical protein